MYNRLKRTSMLTYYRNKVTESRTNTRKLWKMINNIIGNNKHGGSIIPYITVDVIRKYDPCEIANEFGSFYSQLGLKLAKQIQPGSKAINHYISKIPKTINSLALHSTTPTEIEKITKALPNKTSHGHNKISNIMLKTLIEVVSHLLNLIFNQSIATGSFPERMKQAEVVPLYKGKDMDIVINYRPISLLITISKILEKVISR